MGGRGRRSSTSPRSPHRGRWPRRRPADTCRARSGAVKVTPLVGMPASPVPCDATAARSPSRAWNEARHSPMLASGSPVSRRSGALRTKTSNGASSPFGTVPNGPRSQRAGCGAVVVPGLGEAGLLRRGGRGRGRGQDEDDDQQASGEPHRTYASLSLTMTTSERLSSSPSSSGCLKIASSSQSRWGWRTAS